MPDFQAFHDVQFPTAISFGATGGPEWRNEIVALTSGREKRNARQSMSRRRFDAGTGMRSLDDVHEVMRFFEARRGSLHAFRFRDPFDWKSGALNAAISASDQPLGAGDGTRLRFMLTKTYGSGGDAYERRIRLPGIEGLKIAVDGAAMASGQFSFDTATGEVVLDDAPSPGSLVTAGYEFDVPVRFDVEHLSISLIAFKAGQIPTIPLLEVLL